MLHVICGAPCSGKTTYISNHASKNDLIIDADKIAKAFGGSDYHAQGEPLKVALDSRELAIQHALKSKSEAWLIDTMPNDEHLKQYADVDADIVLLDTPKEECLKRAEERPEGTKETIERWFDNVDDLKNKLLIRRNKMAETVNQEPKTTTPEPENKTFTQDEVNSYVAERLARERKKYEGIDLDSLKKKAAEFDKLEEARKTDLEKANDTITALQTELDGLKKSAELREIREKVSKDTGIPVNLLTGDTEELCRAQAEGIKAFAMPNAYPTVKDGGEPMHKSGITARDEFAKFAAQILN